MFLKRLETVGFKSFADRTTIQFVPGITAVVGPNGSGKSNVIDAVRWVLGEQSAKALRGARMEDIIFQGSDSRKALNFAEVTLVLNNEQQVLPIDYQEVSITRRVYRSGESEFYMNKQSCRLKDIVDLFIDTGLGKESFSIIGQGKIDEILSSKAEERRAIFEEAAGVLKYKQRKQRAEVKLAETSNNLDRVQDIIYEIEKQITPLQQQAEKAIIYKEKKEKLERVEVSLLVTEIEALHDEWQTLLQHIEQQKLEEIEEKKTIQQRTAILTETRETMQKLDNDMQSLQADLVQLTEQIEQLDGKKNILEERVKHAEENKEKLEEEHVQQKHKRELTKEKLHGEQVSIDDVMASLQQIAEQIAQLKTKKLNGAEKETEQLESLKADYIEQLNEQAALRNEEKSIIQQLEQLERRNDAQYDSVAQYMEQREKNNIAKNGLETKLETNLVAIEKIELAIQDIRDKQDELEQTYESMQHKLYEGNERIATLASRKEMLEDMKENFQGFFYGVKEILQANKNGSIDKVDGVVLDLMDVPKEYITAIDTILGAQAQYIVVQNDQIARNIIQWLKREKKGRATFLPIASIERRTIQAHLLKNITSETGFIGIASELVHVDDTYRIVVDHLMGNVIVTDTLKNATNIAAKTNRKFRVVTLEGDIVYPGGSMSGGAKRQNNVSLFTREKELKTLTETLTTFEIRREKFLNKMHENQAIQTMNRNKLNEKREQLAEVQAIYDDLQLEWNALNVTIAKTEDQLLAYDLFKTENNEEKSYLMTKQNETTEALNNIAKNIGKTDSAINVLTERLKVLATTERTVEKELHELEKTMIELKERKSHFEQRKNDLQKELQEVDVSCTQIEKELEQTNHFIQQSMQTKTIENDVHELKERRAHVVSQLEKDRTYRNNRLQWIEDEEKEIRGLQLVHDQFVKELQTLEVNANRLDVALETRLDTLQSEYVMTYEYAKQHFGMTENMEATKEQVQQIKQEIDRLGTVNLGAIDEYERLKERDTFLTVQRDDLIDAKETLYTVIREMDKEMTDRFDAVFTVIQQAFSAVFKKLFGGGRASLTLTDPNDLLTTGIDIVAQPPGKKLQSLALLSGGERALTAIALLFAILRTRSVPFVILDEVDAALDESNVMRFSQYLKSYREETQFIVITHRNGTMEEADVLYGVTMQEHGVSKLVSVKLEESKEMVNQG